MQIDMARNVTKKWPFNCNSNFVLENWRAYFQILEAIFFGSAFQHYYDLGESKINNAYYIISFEVGLFGQKNSSISVETTIDL
jgi:membrane-anchored protein YejM (alkaline phosphatase superfamily)